MAHIYSECGFEYEMNNSNVISSLPCFCLSATYYAAIIALQSQMVDIEIWRLVNVITSVDQTCPYPAV